MYKAGLDTAAATTDFLREVSDDYEIALNEGTQIALVYRKRGKDNARNLCVSFYDVEKELWSNEVVLIEESGYIRSFGPVFSQDGVFKIAYTQAEIFTEVVDGEEYFKTNDKVDLNMITYTPLRDLSLDEDAVRLSREIPIPDTRETISVNAGTEFLSPPLPRSIVLVHKKCYNSLIAVRTEL